MLAAALTAYLPARIFRLTARTYRTIRQQLFMDFVPFDRAFPDAEKLCYTPPETAPTPEALVMEFEKAAAELRGPSYTTPEDYVAILPDVLYCPTHNVILTPDRKFLRESVSTGELEVTPIRASSVKVIPGYSALWRSRKNQYYHTLIDNVPRLLSLAAPELQALGTIKLLCPKPLSETESFLLSRLCPDNIEIVTPDEGSLYRLEKLVFTPFKTRRFSGYLPGRYVEQLQAKLLPQRPSRRVNRLYVSRERARKRRVLNEKDLLRAIAPLGFEKVILEDLSLQQQIELFYDSEVVIAPHGAGLANLIFSPSCTVLELFPSARVVPHYYYLSKSLGHRYAYWCGRERKRHDSFQVDARQVLTLLARSGIKEDRSTHVVTPSVLST